MTTPEPIAPAAPLLGEDARQFADLLDSYGSLCAYVGKLQGAARKDRAAEVRRDSDDVRDKVLAAVAALVAERERAAYERGYNDCSAEVDAALGGWS